MTQIPTLTVFTPSYNRAHTLVRTYESLCRQTSKDFEWLIVDDGSTDCTEELVFSWLANNNDFRIRYIKKDNGGLFTGYNTAIANTLTELNVCIDSDDIMPDNAIEKILNIWSNIKGTGTAGIIGLDAFMHNGQPIGGFFSQEDDVYFFEQKYKLHHSGDTKIVCRTRLLQEVYPMSSYGEKNFNPVWYYILIGEKYRFRTSNEIFCIVDYQPDGMGAGIYRQFFNSPKSFAALRILYMNSKIIPLKRKYIDAAHYVSSSIFSKNWDFLKDSAHPWLVLAAIPAGILLHLFILTKLKNA